MNNSNSTPTVQEQLSQLFGSYKAEWLKGQIFDLFTEPSYFPELMTPRSCVLIGGRGTGKTTVLRGLSYTGQFALKERKSSDISTWPYYGLYYRVNTNHVTAFSGAELDDSDWIPLFAHYFNLLLCDLVLDFLEWYEFTTRSTLDIGVQASQRVAQSLHLGPCSGHREIREALTDARIAFEAFVNNVVDAQRPPLSMQSVPVDLLCGSVLAIQEFRDKQFFFLLDEYENLLDYQQQVVNTLIKHSGDHYSFKVGVRELGWRHRSTLNPNEQLVHPADYARISIAEKLQGNAFEEFALNVCRERIARITIPEKDIIRDLRVALPGLDAEEESLKLGVQEQAEPARQKLLQHCESTDTNTILAMHPLEVYFMQQWAESHSQTIEDVLTQEVIAHPGAWTTRYGNYKHAILYSIRRKKRGIRKFYCGWNTLTQLAAGNIRYVLELIDQCFLAQFQETGSLNTPIAPELQTASAQRVGSMNLSELEGLSVDGAQLTKLLLSLGRVFQVMAGEPFGHAPEINQFHLAASEKTLADDSPLSPKVERLLNSAVMHLALLRTPGSKPGDVGDTKDYDYMIHPVFSAFFGFSPRRKRKMALSEDDLLGLIAKPKKTIRALLKGHNRPAEDDLPEQLTLFERFYNADS